MISFIWQVWQDGVGFTGKSKLSLKNPHTAEKLLKDVTCTKNWLSKEGGEDYEHLSLPTTRVKPGKDGKKVSAGKQFPPVTCDGSTIFHSDQVGLQFLAV